MDKKFAQNCIFEKVSANIVLYARKLFKKINFLQIFYLIFAEDKKFIENCIFLKVSANIMLNARKLFKKINFQQIFYLEEFHKLKIVFFQKVSASILLYARKLFEKMQFSIYETLDTSNFFLQYVAPNKKQISF